MKSKLFLLLVLCLLFHEGIAQEKPQAKSLEEILTEAKKQAVKYFGIRRKRSLQVMKKQQKWLHLFTEDLGNYLKFNF